LDFSPKEKRQKRFGIFTLFIEKITGEIQFEASDFMHPGVKLGKSGGSENSFSR